MSCKTWSRLRNLAPYLEAVAQKSKWCPRTKQQTLEEGDTANKEASKGRQNWQIDDLRGHSPHHLCNQRESLWTADSFTKKCCSKGICAGSQYRSVT